MISPLISVIIPIFNSEVFITKCVDSVLNQTYPAFEIILVDDGSQDKSGRICDAYTKRDKRVKAIHKLNGGVSSARNAGLSLSSGEFVCFVDSDDIVDPCFLENLVAAVNDDSIDLVFSSARLNYNGKFAYSPLREGVLTSDHFELFLTDDLLSHHTAPWAKLFRKEIIVSNGISFPINIPIGEDAIFLFDYIPFCRKIAFTNNCGYEYQVLSNNSLTKRLYTLERELEIFSAIERKTQLFRSKISPHSEKQYDMVSVIASGYIIRVLDALYFNATLPHRERLNIISDLPSELVRNIPITGCSIRARILARLLRYRLFSIYDFIRVLARRIRNL